MTLKQTIECDALDCLNELDVDHYGGDTVNAMRQTGWHEDGEFDYCPQCWEQAEREPQKMSTQIYECCECGWKGTDAEKARGPLPKEYRNIKGHTHVCSGCGGEEFYLENQSDE